MTDTGNDDAELERFAAEISRAAEAPALEDPPAELVERASRIPAEEAPPAGARPASWSLARLVRAVLAPTALGVRGAAAGGRRLYEADGGRVDLEIGEDLEDAERWRLVGQLEPADGEGLALLWSGAAVRAHSALDRAGVFVLAGLPEGNYRLEVWSPRSGVAVRIDPFGLPPGEAP